MNERPLLGSGDFRRNGRSWVGSTESGRACLAPLVVIRDASEICPDPAVQAVAKSVPLETARIRVQAYSRFGKDIVLRQRAMLKSLTRSATLLAAAISLTAPTSAQMSTSMDQQLARAITEFSSNACYGIAAGTTFLPNDQSPDALSQTMHVVEKMGLTFGVNDRMLKELGTLGQTLVSRSTIGSKSLDHGDVIVTFGGSQPGCRVILLAEAPVDVTDAVSSNLAGLGWKPVPIMTAQRGALERRAYVKRDAKGNPYLMNLMIIGDPGSKLRLITTTVRVPTGVTLPPGI